MRDLSKNQPLKKIDPRLKIIATVVLIMVTFFISNWIIQGTLLITTIIFVKLAGISILYCLKKLKTPAIMIGIMLILQQLIALHGNLLEMALHGMLTFTRIMIVIIIVIVLTTTTTQQDFILALTAFLTPFNKLGLKTSAIILTCRMIGRFVPSITIEANKILNAQASRGLDIKGANIWQKMRLIGALLLPVFVIAIKRADDLSNAMAVRGYVMDAKRSSYQTLKRAK